MSIDDRLQDKWSRQLDSAMAHRYNGHATIRRDEGPTAFELQQLRTRGMSPQQIAGLGLSQLCTAISDLRLGLDRLGTPEATEASQYMATLLRYALTVTANIISPVEADE